MRAKAIGCSKVSLPARLRRLERRLAVGDPVRVAGEHPRSCSSSKPATRAVRSAMSSEPGCCPYG